MTSSSVEICLRALRFRQAGRETKRRRRAYEKIQIPNDVVEEILLRLPVKSLIRCQSVSKQWRYWIRSRDFGERYISHQKTKDPKLLFVCEGEFNSLILETLALETTPASPEDGHCLNFGKVKGFLEISESCDGLVCMYALTKAVWVINPAISVFRSLPLAKIQRLCTDHPDLKVEKIQHQDQDQSLVPAPLVTFTRLGFGKNSVTGRYKLVWLYNNYPATSASSFFLINNKAADPTSAFSLRKKNNVRCEVLDLEDMKWRFVSTTPLDNHHILYNQRPTFANGSFYWLTGDEQGDPSTQTKLIVFNIHTEMFQLTKTPPFVSRDAYGDRIGLCNLDGRLCISELKGDCKQEFWWRVKDNSTWEKIFSVDLRSTSTWFGGITWQPLTPLAISRENNKVILSLTHQDNLVAFDLDPDSTVYHLYHSDYYGLSVPYFPSLSLGLDVQVSVRFFRVFGSGSDSVFRI